MLGVECWHSSEEQDFYCTPAWNAMAEQARGKNLRVVEHQQVAAVKMVREVGERGVLETAGLAVEHEQTRAAALSRWLLGNQLIW